MSPSDFLSGLTGVLIKEFAFTLAVAVLISGMIALTLSPIMSAYASPAKGQEGCYDTMGLMHVLVACKDAMRHF